MGETAGSSLISSPEGVLSVLVGIAAFFFFLEQKTRWKLFQFFPPLIFIYALPVILTNTGVTPAASPVYDVLRSFGLPMFICLMLLSIDVGAAFRILGRGVLVMLIGTLGIVVGGIVAYFVVHRWLEPDAWKGFGALAGSWIGGTGNLAAVAEGLDAPAEQQGLAIIADTVVYIVWLPIMIGSKGIAERFNRWARVPKDRIARMEAAAAAEAKDERKPKMRDYLYLGVIAVSATWIGGVIAEALPEIGDILSTGTWKVLVITTIGISLSFTPAKRIPGSHEVAMAIVYVFVARMGAQASLTGLAQAPVFVAGAFLWIFIHGGFCVIAARFLHVDIHSVAIASAANVGGAASAPVVAAAHRESLVPASILMALIGYAIGTYAAMFMAGMCKLVAGV
jgi:uncharacterized membrane protein